MKPRIWTLFGALLAAFAFVPRAGAVHARLPDFTDLYEQQGPAVVSIDVTQKVKRSPFPDLSEDDPFYEFFRRFGQIPRGRERPRDFEQQSVGSGFILSARTARFSTNAHVVDDAERSDGEAQRQARVPGQGRRRTDKRTDVARPEDRGDRAAQSHDRRSGQAQGRRVGRGDRQAVRPGEHDHRRHRQRQGPRAAEREQSGAVHSDRRADQSRQLRRTAVQHERRGRRHQFAHLQPHGRLTWGSPSRCRSTWR